MNSYISPIVKVCYNLQQNIGDINLKERVGDKYQHWVTNICVNAETTDLLTENGCTYTLISVPEQKDKCIGDVDFLFQLGKKHNVGIALDDGLSFIFSGKYLTHRQCCKDRQDTEERNFINIASYGNEQLYNSLKATIKRLCN